MPQPHPGLRHVQKKWNDAAERPDAQRAVAFMRDGETFEESGLRALNVLEEALEPRELREFVTLEFGCGLGRITRQLDRLCKKVYAVDIASKMIEEVKKLGLRNTALVVDDGTRLEGKVPQVDLVYSNSVLLHNIKRDVRSLWPRVCQHLNVGGLAAFQLPCYEKGREPGHWTDVGVWTEPEILALANNCGCEPVKIWVNPGVFSFRKIGPHHHRLHIFKRR